MIANTFLLLFILGSASTFAFLTNLDASKILPSDGLSAGEKTCPGLYCGRTVLNTVGTTTNYSSCGVCPRGYRTDAQSICTICEGNLLLYDWLYLGFMALLPLVLNFFFTEFFAKDENIPRNTIWPGEDNIWALHSILCKASLMVTILSQMLSDYPMMGKMAGDTCGKVFGKRDLLHTRPSVAFCSAKVFFVILLHISAFLETAVGAVISVLVVEPFGKMNLNSCGVNRLADWYTMFKNPQPDYSKTLHCTQEAVFPLYTIVFIFYTFELALMMIIRPLLSFKACKNKGRNSIYAALYFLPILVVFHAIFAGLVYYSYAYITIAVSLTTHAIHFAHQEIETPLALLKNRRSMVILLAHWLAHAYSIVAITSFEYPMRDSFLFLMVPVPAVFYILTAKFSDPETLKYGGT